MHEIGHALGMWHEQMRSDRDGSIRINKNNINSRYSSQYHKIDDTYNLVQYNFGSIMHYGARVRSIHHTPFNGTSVTFKPGDFGKNGYNVKGIF